MIRGLAGGALLLLAGCAPDLEALAKDAAPICADFTSVWFTAHVNRYHGCDHVTMP